MNYIKDTIDYIIKLFEWWIIISPWERGIRVRLGKKIKKLTPGVHLKVPFMDKVYSQTIRMRMISMPSITMTTKDKHTLTIVLSIGYSITDILTLYDTLYHPEGTISNVVIAGATKCISSKFLEELSPEVIEREAFDNLNFIEQYGVKLEMVNIIGYAAVRTFRFIQDSNWMPDGVSTERRHGQ